MWSDATSFGPDRTHTSMVASSSFRIDDGRFRMEKKMAVKLKTESENGWNASQYARSATVERGGRERRMEKPEGMIR